MKEILESIVNLGKKVGRKAIAPVLIPMMLASPVRASERGYLETQNYIGPSNTSGLHKTVHWEGNSEELDSYDVIYDPLFNPSGISSKIVSIIPGYELMRDERPLSNIFVDLELSLNSKNGKPITVSNLENELKFEIDPEGTVGNFGTKPITLQQYDPCDPNACYPEYDVRKVINLDGGIIPLPDLNGTYNSEEVYTWFKLAFDKYHTDLNGDQKNNFEDFAIFAGAWQRTGITLADRENPADLAAYADYDLDGNVDTNDLCIFTERWLWDANDPNTW